MPVLDRCLFAALAALWATLGLVTYTNSNVAGAGTGAWLVASCIPAGSALAIAVHGTRFSFRVYVFVVLVYSLVRSTTYIVDSRVATPLIVWLIVLVTSALVCAIEVERETA